MRQACFPVREMVATLKNCSGNLLVKSLLRVGEGGEEHSRGLAQKPSGPILTYLTFGKSVILCLVDKEIIVQRG